MKRAFCLILLSLYILSSGFSQQTTDPKQAFLAAESYYLFEEFDEALPLYLRLHRSEPDNYNLYFKIGVCYLNNPYEKDKSIFYLDKASQNINPKYKESNFKELGAPLDALYFLGTAYRINNELEKAREAYKKFQSRLDPEIYDGKLVTEQLAACDAAEKLMKKPVDLDVEILSNQVNTRFADLNPTVSGDETKMVFISKLQFYDAVFYSEKKNGNWSAPRNITPELGVDGDVYPTSLSFDGTVLFIYRNDEFIGNIYTSRLVNGSWTPLVKLNENINTKFWESHASMSKDGKILYFTSNRKGGYGGLDIYKSYRGSNGDWGPPVNLGPSVNSSYNEETPFITENGRKLFFSSYGHYNMGGYDVFMSVMNPDSSWAAPVNLGYPVNTTDDDIFFSPVNDGEVAYFPVYNETGYGRHDIYRYKVYTADHPRRYDISGILNYSGEKVKGSEVSVTVINIFDNDTAAITNPDDAGKFTFSVPEGKYAMVFDSKRFEREIRELEVNQNTPHTGITLFEPIKLILLPEKLSREELDKKLQIEDSLIFVTKGKAIDINYEAEKGSTVIINQYHDSTLVKTDTVFISRRKQSYELEPKPGLNQVELNLTDKDGNQVSKTVTVIYSRDGDADQQLAQKKNSSAGKQEDLQSEDAVIQNNLGALVSNLSSRAEGPLKGVLENLDLKKEGIRNSKELFDYLYENAGKLGYKTEDVDLLLFDLIAKKNLDEFLADLKNASSGTLKATISGLDLKTNNIKTPHQAVDYLVQNSKIFNYSPEDIISALATVGSAGNKDLNLFINKLIQSSNEGDLKVYLKSLDLSSSEPISPIDFALSLYHNSASKPYSEADVFNALTNLAVNKDAASMLEKLILLADDGNLKDFLSGLDLGKEGIYTAGNLIEHIYANTDLKGYTRDEVNELLGKYLYNQVEEIDDLRLKLAAVSTGNLKSYLEKLDINKHSFGSKQEFIDYLMSEAENNGFTQEDVNNALLRLAYSGDLEDIIRQMTAHSEGNLKHLLENLDPAKEGITSFDQIVSYLLENKDKYGYSEDDVFKMLEAYATATDLQLFINKLKRLADPETILFIERLDLKSNNISDRTDMISFLLKKAEDGTLKPGKIIPLLIKATDVSLGDILPYLKSNSEGELNKLLNSSRLPVKDFSSATDLYNYLISAGEKNREILPGDINSLFSDFILENSLNQFLSRLVASSEGKLNEFLRNIDLKQNNITSITGLVEYLLNNAAENGYTKSDVFSLLEKILDIDKLQDFIDNLKEFASPGLLKLLEQLDLKKAGINNIADLIKYLADYASEYGYTMEDVWNAILQLITSGNNNDSAELEKGTSQPQYSASRGVLITVGVIGILGIIIFFLILLKRKKDKKPA